MFKRLEPSSLPSVKFLFDDQPIEAAQGDTIAAALLLNGVRNTRHTPVSGAPRAPFCMMGTCYECLVIVDGHSVQACMTTAQENMVVQRVPTLGTNND